MGISYYKAAPTEYARITARGKVRKEGKGISTIYFSPWTSIEMVPIDLKSQPLTIKEKSQELQDVTIQGDFTYRVVKPELAIDRFNFVIDPRTSIYLTEDRLDISTYLTQYIQEQARKIVQGTKLEPLLTMNEKISKDVAASLRESDDVRSAGIEISTLQFKEIKPEPNLEKALGAPYREELLGRQDLAVYSRRQQNIVNEHELKERELANDKIIVGKRAELIELEATNRQKEAASKGQALELELAAYRNMEPAILASLGIYHLGQNAANLTNLSLSPELVELLSKRQG